MVDMDMLCALRDFAAFNFFFEMMDILLRKKY